MTNNQRVSVNEYVAVNWSGKTFADVEGEERVEVEDLIADGELYVETPGSKAVN